MAGGPEGVCLLAHGIAGEVLELELAPADDGDHLTLPAHRLRPEGSDWVELYAGPVVALEASAEPVSCPNVTIAGRRRRRCR